MTTDKEKLQSVEVIYGISRNLCMMYSKETAIMVFNLVNPKFAGHCVLSKHQAASLYRILYQLPYVVNIG